jgi:hypothetical protein
MTCGSRCDQKLKFGAPAAVPPEVVVSARAAQDRASRRNVKLTERIADRMEIPLELHAS